MRLCGNVLEEVDYVLAEDRAVTRLVLEELALVTRKHFHADVVWVAGLPAARHIRFLAIGNLPHA